MLTSTRSAHVARLRRLHERKGRQQSGTFLAEGPDCVAAAIAAGWVREVVSVPGHALAEQAGAAGIGVHQADDRVVSAICDAANPQGILAECAIPSTHLQDVVSATGPLVICDGLADPGNLGTIVRTAEAVGAAGVITTRGSVDAWNPKVVRASAGSIFRVPVVQVAHATEAVAAVQAAGWTVVALTADADATVFDVIEHGREHGAAPDRWAWLVGSEAHGVSAEALTDSALRARIPMRSSVESLNAAISVAICLYLAEGRRGTDGT
ncbi:MAG: TrmH family RNA methyltransferase [Candidatus Nanopelagicales bacterium]